MNSTVSSSSTVDFSLNFSPPCSKICSKINRYSITFHYTYIKNKSIFSTTKFLWILVVGRSRKCKVSLVVCEFWLHFSKTSRYMIFFSTPRDVKFYFYKIYQRQFPLKLVIWASNTWLVRKLPNLQYFANKNRLYCQL